MDLCAALVLMGHLKEEIKDSSLIPNMVKSTSFLDACNLLKCSNEVDANIDELSTSLGADIETFLRRYVYRACMNYSSVCLQNTLFSSDLSLGDGY